MLSANIFASFLAHFKHDIFLVKYVEHFLYNSPKKFTFKVVNFEIYEILRKIISLDDSKLSFKCSPF